MSKKLELVRSIEGVELFGKLACWSCNGVKVTYHQVLAALKAADLDQNVARRLLPRNAFKRACKTLASNRVIREIKELSTASELVFQFTSETRGDDQKFRYEIEALVKIHRETGKINCDDEALKSRAQALLDDAVEARTGADVTRIIQRLFEQNADLFPVRDRGGIYFVPIAFNEFLEKIKLFMAKMGGTLDCWPVPAGMVESKSAVKDSITVGLDAAIRDHFDAIEKFDETTRADTYVRHENHLETTRFKLEAYKALLEDRYAALEDALSRAKDKLQDRMAGIFSDFDEPEVKPAAPEPERKPTFEVPPVILPPAVAMEDLPEDNVWESDDRYELPDEPQAEPEPVTVSQPADDKKSDIDSLFDWI